MTTHAPAVDLGPAEPAGDVLGLGHRGTDLLDGGGDVHGAAHGEGVGVVDGRLAVARGGFVTTGTMVPVFAALGDETRWSVLAALGEGDASASALAGRLPVSRQAIAKHLAVLQEVGLVEPVRVGREVQYRVLGARLRATATRLDALGAQWDRRLAAIKEIAENL